MPSRQASAPTTSCPQVAIVLRRGSHRVTSPRDAATTEPLRGCIARPPTPFKTSASDSFRKEVIRLSKARLIYFAVFAILVASALLPALVLFGMHDGSDV